MEHGQRDCIEIAEAYRKLFDLISDSIFLIDKESGRILEANASAPKLYGYSREELFAKRNVDLSAEPDKTREATEKENKTIPTRYHRKKDGTVFPVEIAASHFKWGSRDVHLAVIRDITFRVQAENEKAKLQEQLRQAQKMEAIGTLAGGIAHDFNNILSAVLGFTEIALDEVPNGTSVHDNLQEVLVAGKRAKDLVAQILTFSRRSEQEKRPVLVGPIVSETAKLLRSSSPSTLEIAVRVDADHTTVLGDASQIHQIIMNLGTNAIQALQEDGGRLEISLGIADIDPGLAACLPGLKPGEYLRLEVADTGAGIPDEIIDRVFEPYFTTKGHGKGTGMGLALVHGIVASHNGHIRIQSATGKGTTATVFLPLIAKSAPDGVRSPEQGLPAGTGHILLVDDEVPIVNLLRLVLERLGYTVTASTSGLEALAVFQAAPQRFDAVITDMTMPGLTGERLAQRIKGLRPEIPVVLCTGFSEKISTESAQRLGVDVFLMKPVDRADLARVLRKVLDKDRALSAATSWGTPGDEPSPGVGSSVFQGAVK